MPTNPIIQPISMVYVLAILFAFIAQVPLFFVKTGALADYLNSMYAIYMSISVSLFITDRFIETKNKMNIPVLVMFASIGIIFMMNYFFDEFISTYYPLLTIVLSVSVCYIILYALHLRLNRK